MSDENFEIPEHLLKRSAEAKAKELDLPVEQVLEEMKTGKPAAEVEEVVEEPVTEEEPAAEVEEVVEEPVTEE